MTETRVGLGLDVHPFTDDEGRELILGGVRFPGERALGGHSDADVVSHAIADAILGAAGLGDLGAHFPDTDARWRNSDSLELLARCVGLAARAGWQVHNADCTIFSERPKVAPSREEMMARLGQVVGAPVHVKATRPEGLGALGRAEGIACLAVALLGR